MEQAVDITHFASQVDALEIILELKRKQDVALLNAQIAATLLFGKWSTFENPK
jgi:hypothetical protein